VPEQIEDRLRSILRNEGDGLTLNVSAQELERRLLLRRRARAGRRLRMIAAGIAAVAIGGIVVAGNGWLGSSPAVGGHPAPTAAAITSPSHSAVPSSPELASSSPSASQTDDGSLPCSALDPNQSSGPPILVAAAVPGDAIGFIGETVAAAWNGQATGTPGTWEGLPADPASIIVGPTADRLQAVSEGCFAQVTAEALLTVYAEVPTPSPTPVPLPVIRGGTDSRVVDIQPPSVGGWTVRIRATFLTTDGSTAWSESLFRVLVPFDAPALTMTRPADARSASAVAHCPSYKLATGASASDQCGAPYAPISGVDPLIVTRGATATVALSAGWQIDHVKVTAVAADLVATGQNAPEYSVAFLDTGGPNASFPIVLDPGAWIVRVSVNGSKTNGDTFAAYYDLPVTVTR
jgi:hypothetical protein